MKKWQIAGLVIAVVLIAGIVLADQMTFSTYYPAPYGRYRQFSTTGLTLLATDEFGNEGATALVGIGTTDPGFKLHVYGGIVQFDRAGHGIHFNPNVGETNEYAAMGTLTDLPLRIVTNSFSRITFDTNGNVGIGTSAPTSDANPNNHTAGNLDVGDVWLRDADGGSGAWASESGGGTFDPDPYVGQESVTFPNGMIMKQGTASIASGTKTISISFDEDFNVVKNVQVTLMGIATPDSTDYRVLTGTLTVSGFDVYSYDLNNNGTFHWQAWGY